MPCLLPQYINKFKELYNSGKVNPWTLSQMESSERRKLLAEVVGNNPETVKWLNAEIERNLLKKNFIDALITYAEKQTGVKVEVKQDMLSKIQRMEEMLSPKEQTKFLEDIAEKRMGFRVDKITAAEIVTKSKKATEARKAMLSGVRRVSGEDATPSELAYGRALVEFNNYVSDLKIQSQKQTIGEQLKEPGKVLTGAAGFTKAIKASMDNSALLRQGWKTLWTNPQIWSKNAKQSWIDIGRQYGNKPVMDELMADIVSRPNFDKMKMAKLDVGNIEEAYPTSLPGKIPFLGRAYKASETAYTAFLRRQRADVFDKYIEIAKEGGVDINDKTQLQSIGKLVNSLTGRGDLGKAERAASTINNVFFSPRFLKSNFDVLTAHQLQKDVTPFVRKQAAINLMKIIGGTASVLAIANAVSPGSVEKDPRSSDFGKIKAGNTRFDVTGGMGSLTTLASRLLTMSTKSTMTGKVRDLNEDKFGAPTGKDVIYNFMEGKLSPAAATALTILKGKTYSGEKPTLGKLATDLVVPLPVTNAMELYNDPNSAGVLAGTIADMVGIGTNTYSPKKVKSVTDRQ
jgi:hypothetical protein